MKDGYKKTELGWVPEEWEVNSLKQIVDICYGKSQKEVECEHGIYKILGTGGIIGRTNSYLYDKPSVLIGRKGTIDKPQYIDEPFWTVDTLFYTKIKEDNLAKWLFYYMNNIDLKKYNEATGVPSLSVGNLNNIKIIVPPLNEQQKIAEILSTVDSQIDDTDKLIEKTKELKKGLMQQLLTKGIGHKEFKKTEIGEIPVEWEIMKLMDIAEVVMGQSPTSDSYNNNGIGTPLLNGPTEFTERYPVPKQWTTKTTKLCEKNDILFCVRGSSVGRMNISNGDYCIGRGLAAIREKEGKSVTDYLYYVLQNYINSILNLGVGSTFPNIGKDDLNGTLCTVPTLEEQKQISNILSSADTEIQEHENKKAKLEELKKGLMQQLLSGKVRVI